MTNIVVASGIIKGKFEKYSNDGISFTLLVTGYGSNAKTEEFMVVAYSSAAEKIKASVESGNRIVFTGRVASEKFGDDGVFHNVLNIMRVLAITESEYGSDFIMAVVSGVATSKELQYTPSGAAVVNVNLASSRSYEDKTTKEVKQYVTYLDGTVWKGLAESVNDNMSLPMKEENIVLIGQLKPNNFKNKDGIFTRRLNLWATELFNGKAVEAPLLSSAAPKQDDTPKDSRTSGGSKFGRKPESSANSFKRDVFED